MTEYIRLQKLPLPLTIIFLIRAKLIFNQRNTAMRSLTEFLFCIYYVLFVISKFKHLL